MYHLWPVGGVRWGLRLGVAGLLVLHAGPVGASVWPVQIPRPGPRRPWLVCEEVPEKAAAVGVGSVGPVPVPSQALAPRFRRVDVRPAAPLDRGRGTGLIVAGAGLTLAGAAMGMAASPVWHMQQPGRRESPQGPLVSIGLNSGDHSIERVVLGTAGAVLQALGVGALRRGVAKRNRALGRGSTP